MNSIRKTHKKTKRALPNKKILIKIRKTLPGTRLTIDDPQNDVFDDEIFDDESEVTKEVLSEEEKFEKPW